MKLQQLLTFSKAHPEFLRADKLEKKDIGKVDNI